VRNRLGLLFAVIAAAIIGSGVAAWRWHVAATAAELEVQANLARALLSRAAPPDATALVRALGRPDVNVNLFDAATGTHHDWIDGRPRTTVGFGPPPPPPRSLAHTVADLAAIRPWAIDSGDVRIVLRPSAAALLQWLTGDAIVCLLLLATAGLTLRALHAALENARRRPIARTTLALEALAAGDFTPQSIESGDFPEAARLARAYTDAAATVARSIEERSAAAAEFKRFLADAGHELRTPLTIVGGYLDVLKHRVGESDPTASRAIAGMSAQTARMRSLVEKMLILSRLEANLPTARAVLVGSVSEDVVESLAALYPDRSVARRCDTSACVRLDEDDLYEAQRNLVENALRYAPGSPVEITAETEGDEVVICVRDYGPGIPEYEQAAVFERFVRGSTRADSEGSGLGLAIVRRVAQRWGGSVKLHSGTTGTCVEMRFPRAVPET
jgi:signal transduction histidine kinase